MLIISNETPMNRTDESLISLRRILRSTELYGRKLAAEAGLTAVQLRVLQIIAETGSSTAKQLSTRMGVTQATMTALVDKLEKKQLLTRHRSEVDKRQMDLVITDLGRDKVNDAPDPLQQRYVRAFEAMEPWEQLMVNAVLERVAGMLDASDIDASPVLDSGDLRAVR